MNARMNSTGTGKADREVRKGSPGRSVADGAINRGARLQVVGEQKLGSTRFMCSRRRPARVQAAQYRAKVLTAWRANFGSTKRHSSGSRSKPQSSTRYQSQFSRRGRAGTHFELEKMSLDDHLWLPKHFAMKSRPNILLFTRKSQADETYSATTKVLPFKPSPLRSELECMLSFL